MCLDEAFKKEIILLLIGFFTGIIAGVVTPLAVDYIDSQYKDPAVASPWGYAVVRGYFDWPSDMLVYPLDWENPGGTNVLIRNPVLVLEKPTGEKYSFEMAGYFDEISSRAFKDYSHITRNFFISKNSVQTSIIGFRPKEFWNKSNQSDYNFKFEPGEMYFVNLSFIADQPQSPGHHLIKTKLPPLIIYGTVDNLKPINNNDYGFDYFPIAENNN